jgi:hypothetical protein
MSENLGITVVPDETTKAVERVYPEWDRACSDDDLEAMIALYAPDAILESPLHPRSPIRARRRPKEPARRKAAAPLFYGARAGGLKSRSKYTLLHAGPERHQKPSLPTGRRCAISVAS